MRERGDEKEAYEKISDKRVAVCVYVSENTMQIYMSHLCKDAREVSAGELSNETGEL